MECLAGALGLEVDGLVLPGRLVLAVWALGICRGIWRKRGSNRLHTVESPLRQEVLYETAIFGRSSSSPTSINNGLI
jgi:hypothetical protein